MIFWFCCLCVAAADPVAFLGVADVGGGRALFGHVFLVLAPGADALIEASAYQFAIDVPDHTSFDPRALDRLKSFPFSLARTPALDLIARYTAEDRAVVLYQLRLDRGEGSRVRAAFERERAERVAHPRADFSLAHNCATSTFALLNQALGVREFVYDRPTKLLNPLNLGRTGSAWLAIPVAAAPRLARHPRVVGRRVFPPRSATELSTLIAGGRDLDQLLKRCGISARARRAMGRAFAQKQIRESAAYVTAFRKLTAPCATTPDGAAGIEDHLEFLDYLAASAKPRRE